MTRSQVLWLCFLVIAVISSGIGVVYAKNQSRALFVDQQKLRQQHELEIAEWGRLQLELANKGSLDDVMRIAAERLDMHAPAPSDRVVVD